MKSTLLAVAIAAAVFSVTAASAAPPAANPAIAAAVAGSHRPAKDTDEDAVRHPAELVAFSKVKAGDTVMDVWPGGGYWSRLFSPVVGPKGKVYAYVPAEITSFKSDPLAIARALAAEPAYHNIEAISDPLASPPPAKMFNTFDVIWTFENYHDLHDSFMKGASVDAFNQAVFKLLKPGGYYVIVDHAAAKGQGLKNTEDLHRIEVATVKAEVEKAGFVLDEESALLANAADDHTMKIFDPAVKGKTDRFMLRFRKPAK
ncbi:hypothetical protein KPL74_06055 [Bacillus sp. NP157]|nr:hypothetical protein KPL74_06055 [Bacillus sp. NP157]